MPFPSPSPSSSSPSAASRHARRLVWPLAGTVGVTFGAVLYGFSVLITEQAAGAVFSTSLLSAAFGGSVLTGGTCTVPVGRWADRAGIRGILALGAALVGAGFALFAVATEGWQVLVAWWLLIGPGSAMTLLDPAFVALEQWFDRAGRNRAAGTLTLLTGLAGPVFVPSTQALVSSVGWRVAAVVLGGLVLGAGWLTAAVALRVAPKPGPANTVTQGARVRDLVRTPRFLLFSAGVLLLFAVLDAVQVHRIARFEESGFAVSVLAGWAAAASLASLPGRYLVPRLADRVHAGVLMTVLAGLLVPALALTVRGAAPWEMRGHFLLFGLLFGATIPLRTVVMGDWYGGARFGALMGVQGFAIALGRAGGPAAAGWLRDATGSYRAGMLLLTLLVGAAAVLIAAAARAGARRGSPSRPGPG